MIITSLYYYFLFCTLISVNPSRWSVLYHWFYHAVDVDVLITVCAFRRNLHHTQTLLAVHLSLIFCVVMSLALKLTWLSHSDFIVTVHLKSKWFAVKQFSCPLGYIYMSIIGDYLLPFLFPSSRWNDIVSPSFQCQLMT